MLGVEKALTKGIFFMTKTMVRKGNENEAFSPRNDNSLQVCTALSSPNFQPDWSIVPFILDIKLILEDHASWNFVHVRRNANTIAHNLAKWAAQRILLAIFLQIVFHWKF